MDGRVIRSVMALLVLGFVQENHAPVVKLISPTANSVFDANTPIRYRISVSDKEDGESKFQEINDKEVFLEVRWIGGTGMGNTGIGGAGIGNAGTPGRYIEDGRNGMGSSPGLEMIKGSNCLNCHAFRGKLIGPSFYDISKRYPYSPANVDTLVRRIREGAGGVWGNVKMPTHPELTKAQTADIVQWILRSAANPWVSYYSGSEGAFRLMMPEGPAAAAGAGREGNGSGTAATGPGMGKGVFLLFASYTDHGLKDKTGARLRGWDSVRIGIK